MDYILSPCALVAEGVARIIEEGGTPAIVLPTEAPTLFTCPRRMVVYLPDAPDLMLATLQQAATLLEQSATPLPVLILSRCPTSWLWHTLLHQVTDCHRLSAVRAVASDLPLPYLSALLRDALFEGYPSLEQLSGEETRMGGKRPAGLTRPELNATLGLFNGYSAFEQAKRRGISHKTLYNQRTAGLKKMVQHHPHMRPRFPGSQIREQKNAAFPALSAFEREFVHAIHSRHVFPVFQPITSQHLRLQGMEILCRWARNGDVLLPGDFLPRIHSGYAWLVLTAFMLQQAVQHINRYPGEFYFSVNIAAAIAGHENLLPMMETARKQIHQPRMADRLVLELAETTDLNRHSKASENIVRLHKHGFRIMLDDYFSQSSVLFPVRTCRFSAYKLDMSIVNDMQRDPHALALIKSLLYYCQLTGSDCIAEGVDSLDKFNKLKALGIAHFQGFYLSMPVGTEAIAGLIQKLSPGVNNQSSAVINSAAHDYQPQTLVSSSDS
ncbi:EAL domain-containing protein [Klebsiella indica]|uniref:EAL domain-containing protein n=1 Tax=Klebsiella indica TaxID=2582917 RepID=UPI0015D01017|nr:EAL domain-containing protein [Klebsiella indica]